MCWKSSPRCWGPALEGMQAYCCKSFELRCLGSVSKKGEPEPTAILGRLLLGEILAAVATFSLTENSSHLFFFSLFFRQRTNLTELSHNDTHFDHRLFSGLRIHFSVLLWRSPVEIIFRTFGLATNNLNLSQFVLLWSTFALLTFTSLVVTPRNLFALAWSSL